MNRQDQVRFKELITLASETYGKEFTPTEVKSWWSIFKPYSIGEFEQALYSHITCPDAGMFKPLPAHLMKHLRGTTKKNEQSVKDRAEISWSCIEGEIRRIGVYGTLELEDKQSIAAVKAIGGWRQLCMSTYDQLVWKKKEFMSAYDTYERTPLENLPGKLPGLIEISEHKKDGKKTIKSIFDGMQDYLQRDEVRKISNTDDSKQL